MSRATVQVDEVTRAYPGGFRLGPLTFELTPGIVALLGENGAGKSTLLRILSTTVPPATGSMSILGRSSSTRSGRDRCRRELGYLPQELSLPGFARCADYLHHAAWARQLPCRDRAEAVRRALAAVGLEDRARSRIRTLSGGMKRRLGIAQAIIHRPTLVLLDEPTAGLDPRQRIELRALIRRIAGEEVCVLVATHLVEDAGILADRVLVLDGGTFAFDGTVDALRGRSRPDLSGDNDLERALSSILVGGAR